MLFAIEQSTIGYCATNASRFRFLRLEVPPTDRCEAYNKGDDWFEATLADPMVYTGALYAPGEGRVRKEKNASHTIAPSQSFIGFPSCKQWNKHVGHMP